MLVANTIRFCPHLVFITGFVAIVTWRVTPVEQKLLTLPEYLSSSPVFKVSWSLVFCVMFCKSLFVLLSPFFWLLYCLSFYLRLLINPLVSSNFCCPFVSFLLTIVLSVLHFTAAGYLFSIIKLFLHVY